MLIFLKFILHIITSSAFTCVQNQDSLNFICPDYATIDGGGFSTTTCTDNLNFRGYLAYDSVGDACQYSYYCKPGSQFYATTCASRASNGGDCNGLVSVPAVLPSQSSSEPVKPIKVADNNCESFGLTEITTPAECLAKRLEISNGVVDWTIVMPTYTNSDTVGTTLAAGCSYDQTKRWLRFNQNAGAPALTNLGYQAYCNCDGMQTVTSISESNACVLSNQLEVTMAIDGTTPISSQAQLADLCQRTKTCFGYGIVDAGPAYYMFTSTPTAEVGVPGKCYSASASTITYERDLGGTPNPNIWYMALDVAPCGNYANRFCRDAADANDCQNVLAPHFSVTTQDYVGAYYEDENILHGCIQTDGNQIQFNNFFATVFGKPLYATYAAWNPVCDGAKNYVTSNCYGDVNAADPFTPLVHNQGGSFDYYVVSSLPAAATEVAKWFDNDVATVGVVDVQTVIDRSITVTLVYTSRNIQVNGFNLFVFESGANAEGVLESTYPSCVEVWYTTASPSAADYESSFVYVNTTAETCNLPIGAGTSTWKKWAIASLNWAAAKTASSVRFKITSNSLSNTVIHVADIKVFGSELNFDPTAAPSNAPSASPTTSTPSVAPTIEPTFAPSVPPTTSFPSVEPTNFPSAYPTLPQIYGPSRCYNFEISSNMYVYPYDNLTWSEIASTFVLGAVPYIGDIDAVVETNCTQLTNSLDSYAWLNCFAPYHIISTFRITTAQGYTGVEVWEEDDFPTKWEQEVAHMNWDMSDPNCKWPNGNDGNDSCALLPLTGSQVNTIRMEMWCEKRPDDNRPAPFIIAWRDASGVQYTYRPVINDTLARMVFQDPPQGDNLEPESAWGTFKAPLVVIAILLFLFTIIFCWALTSESARSDTFDFMLDTRKFRTDEKVAMAYLPKTVFGDELQPLTKQAIDKDTHSGDESIIRVWAQYVEEIVDEHGQLPNGFQLRIYNDPDGKHEIGVVDIYQKAGWQDGDKYLGMYSAELYEMHVTDDIPRGLRKFCYISKVGPHIGDKRAVKRKPFDFVREELLHWEKWRRDNDEKVFYIEFRDTWKSRPFEYKLLKNKLDTTAHHWNSQDIHHHADKVLAIRERKRFASKRHCPYVCITVALRIVYMVLFTLSFCILVFREINKKHFDTLDWYGDVFARERDSQLFNMSVEIEDWYDVHQGTTAEGNISLQIDLLRQQCFVDFLVQYRIQVDDQQEWQVDNHTAQMDLILTELNLERYEYIAIQIDSDRTCDTSLEVMTAEKKTEVFIGCDDHVDWLQGIEYSECSAYCWRYNTNKSSIPYDVASQLNQEAYNANCTHTTYYYNSKCCDLHLKANASDTCEYTGEYGAIGNSYVTYDFGQTSAVYEVSENSDAFLTGFVQVEFCSVNYDSIYIEGNELWVTTDAANAVTGKAYAGLDSSCASTGGQNLLNAMKISYGDIIGGSGEVAVGTSQPMWNSGATAPAKYTLPTDAIPTGCSFYSFGYQASTISEMVEQSWSIPIPFNSEAIYSVSSSNNIRTGKVELPMTNVPAGNGQQWIVKLPIILTCPLVGSGNFFTQTVPAATEAENALFDACNAQSSFGGVVMASSVCASAAQALSLPSTAVQAVTTHLSPFGCYSDTANPNSTLYFNDVRGAASVSGDTLAIGTCRTGCYTYDELCKLGYDCAHQPSHCECYSKYLTDCKVMGYPTAEAEASGDQSQLQYICSKNSEAEVARTLSEETGWTISTCLQNCTDNTLCTAVTFLATDVANIMSSTGTCRLINIDTTLFSSYLKFNKDGVSCRKDSLYSFVVANKTCTDSDGNRPFGVQRNTAGVAMTLLECEESARTYFNSLGEVSTFFTFYSDTGNCLVHDYDFCSTNYQENIFETQFTQTPPRQTPAVLSSIEDRTTARVMDWASPDYFCGLTGAEVETLPITSTEECTSELVDQGVCESETQATYEKIVDANDPTIDLFDLLWANCQANVWCVGFGVRRNDTANTQQYFRFKRMGSPLVGTDAGYCVNLVQPVIWVPPNEVSAYYAARAAQSEEEYELAVTDMNYRYDEILGGLLGTTDGGFHLQFDNSQGNTYGFGSGSYVYDFSGGGAADGSNSNQSQNIEFFVPFNCPGCPNEYDLPETLSSDYIVSYVNNQSAPEAQNFSAENLVATPAVSVPMPEVPDIWDWGFDLDLPLPSIPWFLLVWIGFDVALTIYRVWHTSAIAAELIRGRDVFVNMKYLRDFDDIVADQKCCDGRSWADMFLSCFLYIHEKIFNLHYYCWVVCPYIMLLGNLAMICIVLFVAYIVIYQVVRLDVIDGLGIFSAMTAAIGTQKAIRNEVLCFNAFYTNNVQASALQSEINYEIAIDINRIYDRNVDELTRVNDFNGNLEESYKLFFSQSRQLTIEDSYITLTNISSNPSSATLLTDNRLTNGGWRPAVTDTQPNGTQVDMNSDSWTGFEFEVTKEFLLPNEPWFHISAVSVNFRYACDDSLTDRGDAQLEYIISFLTENSTGGWNWESVSQVYAGKGTAYQTTSTTGGEVVDQCTNPQLTCMYCSSSKEANVRAVRVTFPNPAGFGAYGAGERSGDTGLGYEVAEVEIHGFVPDGNYDIPYVTYYPVYVDPYEYMNDTCPNGITPVFGYMFRGFSRAQWNSDLKHAHSPYVGAIRQIMLSPFVILLVLVIIYTIVILARFVLEFVLIRADMLRENPYTKVPLVEHADKWKVVGLDPNYPKDDPFTFMIKYPAPCKFTIKEKKRGLMKWKKNDAKNFYIRVYDIEKQIIAAVIPGEAKNRKYVCEIMFPEEGVYWIEVLYYGLPVGQSPFEVDVVKGGDTRLSMLRKTEQPIVSPYPQSDEEFDNVSVDDNNFDLDAYDKNFDDASVVVGSPAKGVGVEEIDMQIDQDHHHPGGKRDPVYADEAEGEGETALEMTSIKPGSKKKEVQNKLAALSFGLNAPGADAQYYQSDEENFAMKDNEFTDRQIPSKEDESDELVVVGVGQV